MKKFLVALMTALACLCLVACAPSNLEKAEEKMEGAGYDVVVSDEDAAELAAGETAVGMIVATKGGFNLSDGLNVDAITAILFESSSAAKDYYEKHKDEEADKEDQVIKCTGKWVFVGTESAINDFVK